MRLVEREGAEPAVDDVEDRAAAFSGAVAVHDGAGDQHVVVLAVDIDRAAAAAALRSRRGGGGPPAHPLVFDERAVGDVPLDLDAAQCSTVRAAAAAEGGVRDVDGTVAVLGERADRTPAEIRAERVAAVVDEPRVDGLELTSLDVDRPTTGDPAVPALRSVVGAGRLMRPVVPVLEGDVLHDDPWIRLVDAVGGRPLACARVGEQHAAFASSTQRDQS